VNEDMEKIRLGSTDLYVSPICYGTWEIGGMPFFQTPDRDTSIRAIHAALDSGINFIDTAPVYGFGRSEELLGQAILGRDVVIATKCGLYWESDNVDSINVDNNPHFIRKDLEAGHEENIEETVPGATGPNARRIVRRPIDNRPYYQWAVEIIQNEIILLAMQQI